MEEVVDIGEGERVFGTRIPNPSVLRLRRESTVSEVGWEKGGKVLRLSC